MNLIDQRVTMRAFFASVGSHTFKPRVDVHFPLSFDNDELEKYSPRAAVSFQPCTDFEREGFPHEFN